MCDTMYARRKIWSAFLWNTRPTPSDPLKEQYFLLWGYPLVGHKIGFPPRASKSEIYFQQSVEFVIIIIRRSGSRGFPGEEVEFGPGYITSWL